MKKGVYTIMLLFAIYHTMAQSSRFELASMIDTAIQMKCQISSPRKVPHYIYLPGTKYDYSDHLSLGNEYNFIFIDIFNPLIKNLLKKRLKVWKVGIRQYGELLDIHISEVSCKHLKNNGYDMLTTKTTYDTFRYDYALKKWSLLSTYDKMD